MNNSDGSGSNNNPNTGNGGSVQSMGGVTNLVDWIEKIKNVKELMLLAAFFGGAIVWTVHYYATQDELDEVECQMKLYVRMLQATSDRQFTEQLVKSARGEIVDEKRTLKKAETTQDEARIKLSQTRIDDLRAQLDGFKNVIGEQSKSSKKALDALSHNACLIEDTRRELLKEIREGKF